MADASGELRIELMLSSGLRTPCGLERVGRRRATAIDRRRALAEAELTRGHELRRQKTPESCRTGIPFYESAGRRFVELGLPRRRVEALLGLGQLQQECLHQDTEAVRTYTRMEPLFAGDPALEAIVRLNLGQLRYGLGDLDGAIAEDRRSMALSRSLGDRDAESVAASSLGHALHLRGRYDEAAAFYGRALALRTPGDDPVKRATILLNWGQLQRDLGELGQARERFNAALTLFRQAADRPGEAMALHALGLVAQDAGRPADALKLLQEALKLRAPGSSGRAKTLMALGVASRHLGRLNDAHRAYSEALQIFDSLGNIHEQALSLSNLGRLEATFGDEAKALAEFDRALELFRSLDPSPDVAYVLEGKAWVLRRRGDLEGARGLMEEALAAIEQRRFSQTSDTTRAEFFSTRQGTYDAFIDLLMEMHRKAPAAGWDAAALEVGERALARSLLDHLATSGAAVPDAALTQPRPWSASEIQRRLLDPGTLLLEYRLGEERSVLWAVTSDSLQVFELPARAEIEGVAGKACALLARSRGRTAELSAGPQLAKLSRMLLGPVAPLLAGRRLLVVGDGILQSVPFAALPEPRPDSDTAEPLVARHDVVSLPSMSVLGELRREAAGRPRAPKTLWALADPDFGGRFPKIPWTRQEAAAILALAPPSERAEVLDRQASRAAVLDPALRDYRILHFATHHSFTAADPEGGRLVLAQVDPRGRPAENGFLRLADIYKLDLNADLVVLSACQSAQGREVRGEGILGMTRGFFYAGAERVLVSLWNVNDQVSVELMRRFYHGLLTEGLSPAAALREAQNAIRSQPRWRSPYYWAGFTLQGTW